MAAFGWTVQTAVAESAHDIVAAFFCGLPLYPYEPKSTSPYKLTLKRGKWTKFLFDSDIRVGDLPTTLIVTVRPDPAGKLDWSFHYDVKMGSESGKSHRYLESSLKEEVDNFITYFNGFAGQQGRLPPGQTQ